jgi:hypothetical protein
VAICGANRYHSVTGFSACSIRISYLNGGAFLSVAQADSLNQERRGREPHAFG